VHEVAEASRKKKKKGRKRGNRREADEGWCSRFFFLFISLISSRQRKKGERGKKMGGLKLRICAPPGLIYIWSSLREKGKKEEKRREEKRVGNPGRVTSISPLVLPRSGA